MNFRSTVLKKAIVLLSLLLVACILCSCTSKPQEEVSRELEYEDISTGKVNWKVETCRLITDASGSCIKGRVKNISGLTTAGLTLYVKFLDENGDVLVTGSCSDVFEEAIEPNGTGGYTVQIKNFFYPEQIVSATFEVGK